MDRARTNGDGNNVAGFTNGFESAGAATRPRATGGAEKRRMSKSKRMLFRSWRSAALGLAVIGLACVWGGSTCTPEHPVPPFPQQAWPTSLHATRRGKATFYNAENGGFGTLTGIAIEDLWCQDCHANTRADGTPIDSSTYRPDCSDCHITPGDAVAEIICLKCHDRRRIERNRFTDVHRDQGMTCMDCHTTREMCGDGTPYPSMMEPGAMDVTCEGCHADRPDNTSHSVHASRVHCSSCHAQAVVVCYNCHFQQDPGGGRPTTHVGPVMREFTFLVRQAKTGQVHTATMVPAVWEDSSFVLITPYASHTITAKGRPCDACHYNQTVRKYAETGRITVTRWDADESQLIQPRGVIPVPPDWRQAMQFDFIEYLRNPDLPEDDPGQWAFLKSGADLMQMMYAEPLTAEQMDRLEVQRYRD